MPNIFYPCCDVGEQIPFTEGPLKSNCWSCGDPEFLRVTEMEDSREQGFFRYSKFMSGGGVRVIFTGAPEPWRL